MNAVEDVEIVQSGFDGGKEALVVRGVGYICLPAHWRRECPEESEAPAPYRLSVHAQCSALFTQGR